MKKEILNHTLTLTLPLDKVAKDFKYNLEVDSYENTYHNGYGKKDVRGMKPYLPKDLDDKLALIFASEVGSALEDAEREAIAEAMVKHRKNALEEALLKIDLSAGGADYTTGDLESISAKAGIQSVKINSEDNTIQVEVLNPEHLINTMIHGEGRIYPDLDAYEASDVSEIISRFHNLHDYFSIYGESQPSGDLPSYYQESINDDYFSSLIKDNISNLSLNDVAESILDYLEYQDDDKNAVLNLVASVTEYKVEEIKEEIKSILKDKQNAMEEEIKSWN